ncbi:MAG: lipopolysaccharide kinase InaA family protein [Planctomycetota bacterium]
MRVLDPGGPWKAAVGVFATSAGTAMVVKDLRPMWAPLRVTYGRWMQARELRALRQLEGLPGVPRVLGIIDRNAFAEAMIEGEHFHRAIDAARLPRIFANLARTIASLHARGVVHLDLREKKNILITRDDETVLLDFESALSLGAGPVGRWLTRVLARLDRSALLKFKAKLAPELLTPREQERLKRYDRMARLWFVKDLVGFLKRRLSGTRRTPRRTGQGTSKQSNTQDV